MVKEREEAVRDIMVRLGYAVVEKYQSTTWYRRDCGSHVLWIEIYYERGGSWLPEEGYYMHFKFLPPSEPQPESLTLHGNRGLLWHTGDRCLGCHMLDVEKGVAEIVQNIQRKFRDDLQRAYERYQQVSGLTP